MFERLQGVAAGPKVAVVIVGRSVGVPKLIDMLTGMPNEKFWT